VLPTGKLKMEDTTDNKTLQEIKLIEQIAAQLKAWAESDEMSKADKLKTIKELPQNDRFTPMLLRSLELGKPKKVEELWKSDNPAYELIRDLECIPLKDESFSDFYRGLRSFQIWPELPQRFETILQWLYWHKPKMAERIERKFKNFWDNLEQTKKAIETADSDRFKWNVCKTRLSADQLAESLLHIEKISKNELVVQKPEETEQNITPARNHRIWTCIRTVGEKAWQIFTKSFWEAVLDKISPK